MSEQDNDNGNGNYNNNSDDNGTKITKLNKLYNDQPPAPNDHHTPQPLQSTYRPHREISPVIGVILMVAITVILAAVIAAFVFGMSGNIAETESFTRDILTKTSVVHIEHTGFLNGIEVLVDSDGTAYSWDGQRPYSESINYHNVTFSYYTDETTYGYPTVLGVTADHSIICSETCVCGEGK